MSQSLEELQSKSICKVLRTFARIVCAQPFCAGNATVICHASLRLTGSEDIHGVENAGEKKFQAEFTPLDHW